MDLWWLEGLLWLTGLSWQTGLLWRAGLPRAGLRSSPNPKHRGVPDTPHSAGLGLLRSPARGKPVCHNKPARHKRPSRHGNLAAAGLRQAAGSPASKAAG
ncbi:hypothetical protein GDV60_25650 [Pseudomonas sp. DTU12.1]|nr:hypothetical protein GDV60_25650 [Pseudomonas sp. DTU12.1]